MAETLEERLQRMDAGTAGKVGDAPKTLEDRLNALGPDDQDYGPGNKWTPNQANVIGLMESARLR
jgi:hypothetical protein